jgi:nicotinate-nucleotide adenylyltransferase
MKKIGFFGGTFDPIHFGHINLALELLEKHRLDEVLFCIAARSPFKKSRPPVASAEHRLAIAELALRDIPSFRVCKIELNRAGISYTVDSLRMLRTHYDQKKEPVQLYILLSDEILESFHLWKGANEIVEMARPLIGLRGMNQKKIPSSPVKGALLRGLTPTTRFEISSSRIRTRLKKKLYCGHLVPVKSLDYIERNCLYSPFTFQ